MSSTERVRRHREKRREFKRSVSIDVHMVDDIETLKHLTFLTEADEDNPCAIARAVEKLLTATREAMEEE